MKDIEEEVGEEKKEKMESQLPLFLTTNTWPTIWWAQSHYLVCPLCYLQGNKPNTFPQTSHKYKCSREQNPVVHHYRQSPKLKIIFVLHLWTQVLDKVQFFLVVMSFNLQFFTNLHRETGYMAQIPYSNSVD